ncbi:Ppx/GppA family phosphatase [Psychrobacillus sp. NEAU-3TGS]|uniref:Ppx/GppA family phosphatase n=1 Tax=Psychrobacillus sp. NEAU-3TGS TaxID=2995412 RepID=UPI002496554D|nr:Ppx/GppA family phosphatase [Psychrobacillus sp. NEAU-3TGS]MDI2589049.1 Ppx/GppA family phosphatase [Psychrobacillus sp. NEAU-3TGS]
MDTMTNRRAIIDIGSNSIRLVVYSYNSLQGLLEHHNFKTVARLSMYIDSKGNLNEDGVQVLLETLTKFKEILKDIQVKHVFAAATAAIRQAENKEEILAYIEDKLGLSLSILTAEQEAYFGYLAVIHSTNIPTAITIDMGGGSTEITYYENKKLVHMHSLPFGAVSLKRRFMENAEMTPEERSELSNYIMEQLRPLTWIHSLQVPIVAIGGSARNIAQVDQQRKDFPLNGIHQYELQAIDLEDISSQFANCSLDELKKIDGLSSDRADIIVTALETFRLFMDVVKSPSFIYSKRGLREGIILSELVEKYPIEFNVNEVAQNAIRHILGKFHVNEESTLHLYDIFTTIYEQFIEWNYIEPLENEQLLRYAYILFYIGEHIDQDAASQHTFYLLTNLNVDGLSNEERLIIALLSSYKNKDTFKQYVFAYEKIIPGNEAKKLRDIGALIRFTKGMDVLGRSNIKQVTLTQASDEIVLTFTVAGNYLLEKYQAEKLKKHLEKIVNHQVILVFN